MRQPFLRNASTPAQPGCFCFHRPGRVTRRHIHDDDVTSGTVTRMRRPRLLDILGTITAVVTLALTSIAWWTGSVALVTAGVAVALFGLALEPLARRRRKRRVA